MIPCLALLRADGTIAELFIRRGDSETAPKRVLPGTGVIARRGASLRYGMAVVRMANAAKLCMAT